MIERILEKNIKDWLFKGKVLIIYGARQVGKTTLAKKIASQHEDSLYLNCESLEVRDRLSEPRPEYIKSFFGKSKLVILDEAQIIHNIGSILKIMIDTYPDLQIIATGSSSFDLAGKVGEPLVGRAIYFTLFPLTISELAGSYTGPKADKIDWMMRFGAYPELINFDEKQAKEKLDQLVSGYLYKDILQFEGIRKPDLVVKLLQLLAFQIGNDVSYNKLARDLKVSHYLVEKYIDILEKSFVIVRLRAIGRNPRNEVTKSVKIYFVDLGMRNSLIHDYNTLDLRKDIGHVWENFCVMEKIKYNHYYQTHIGQYFWRNLKKIEIDYVEEANGQVTGYEFKWGKCDAREPKDFTSDYAPIFKCINRSNFEELFN